MENKGPPGIMLNAAEYIGTAWNRAKPQVRNYTYSWVDRGEAWNLAGEDPDWSRWRRTLQGYLYE